MLTKENSQINTVIPDVLKLLDAEKNSLKKVIKKKRVSLQPLEKEPVDIDDWNEPKPKPTSRTFSSNNNNNVNSSVDGWDVPLDLNVPIQEEPKITSNTNDVNGWDVPLDLDIPIPESKPEVKPKDSVDGWDVPLDLDIPMPESKPEVKPKDSVDGWDVPLDLDIPIPESKSENKSKDNVDGWDVPLDLDVQLPESETTEIKPENNANGWDVPLDLPLPEPTHKEEEKKPINKFNAEKTTSDWDIPLDMDIPLPEPEPKEEEKKISTTEQTTGDWDIPLDMDIPIPPVESITDANQPTSVTANEGNGWDIPLNDIPMPSVDNVPLSSSPKKNSVGWDIPKSEMKPLEEKETETNETDEVIPLPEEYKQILETIKLDRNLHILICSRGFINQFISSPLFQPLIQSVLTPISLAQSQQKANQSMVSRKFSEYHNLLGYIVASLVSNGFINEAARLVYFYMNNNENDTKEPQEIHMGLVHRFKLLKSYLKKTLIKINHRIKSQTKDRDDSNLLLRLNDQPQSIENAIIHEYMDLTQIKEKLEKAIEFIEHILN